METIKERFNNYLSLSKRKNYIGINYAQDALEAYKYIYPDKNEDYVDADMYSPLLYKFWGEYLKKMNVIIKYSVEFRNYRYVLNAHYTDNKTIILGSDGLMSIGKCGIEKIYSHKFIGGFALWPSHRGGINFRKNRYNDDIFLTLDDINKFRPLENEQYKGVIPKIDYDWFNHIASKVTGGFFHAFSFDEYEKYKDTNYNNLLAFENYRTQKMIEFMNK